MLVFLVVLIAFALVCCSVRCLFSFVCFVVVFVFNLYQLLLNSFINGPIGVRIIYIIL